jgi:DGQHR domain-containing protein
MKIKRSAVKIEQGTLTIYTTSLKVEHLLQNDFYKVDKLDSSDNSTGFQRVLDKARAKRLSNYLVDGWNDGDVFLPTSIFLATDKEIEYDHTKKEITIDLNNIGPFNVVDGQHRIEGLILAAKEKPEIKEFEVLANIASGLDEISQMCHFLIVNTTQKAVDKSVAQQIVARLSGMVDIEDIPTLPKWIQRQVLKGEDKEALIITNYLNTEIDSPWYDKIRMANEPKKDSTTINQNSFVQTIKTYILASNNPLLAVNDIDKRNKILKNYWKAIAELLTDESDESTVLFKTIGLELFSLVSSTVFNKLFTDSDFRVQRIKEIFENALNIMPTEHISIKHSDWWKSGGGASSINKQAARKIAHELNKCINQPTQNQGTLLI